MSGEFAAAVDYGSLWLLRTWPDHGRGLGVTEQMLEILATLVACVPVVMWISFFYFAGLEGYRPTARDVGPLLLEPLRARREFSRFTADMWFSGKRRRVVTWALWGMLVVAGSNYTVVAVAYAAALLSLPVAYHIGKSRTRSGADRCTWCEARSGEGASLCRGCAKILEAERDLRRLEPSSNAPANACLGLLPSSAQWFLKLRLLDHQLRGARVPGGVPLQDLAGSLPVALEDYSLMDAAREFESLLEPPEANSLFSEDGRSRSEDAEVADVFLSSCLANMLRELAGRAACEDIQEALLDIRERLDARCRASQRRTRLQLLGGVALGLAFLSILALLAVHQCKGGSHDGSSIPRSEHRELSSSPPHLEGVVLAQVKYDMEAPRQFRCEQRVVGGEWAPTYTTWRLIQPGTSEAVVVFTLDVVPSRCQLVLDHLTSYAEGARGNGYAPVTVRLNERVVVEHYDVAAHHDGTHVFWLESWPVASLLVPGRNELHIAYEQDAESHYWLRELRISVLPSDR